MRRHLSTLTLGVILAVGGCQRGSGDGGATERANEAHGETGPAPNAPGAYAPPETTTGAAGATTGAADPNPAGAGATTGAEPGAPTGGMGSTSPTSPNPGSGGTPPQ